MSRRCPGRTSADGTPLRASAHGRVCRPHRDGQTVTATVTWWGHSTTTWQDGDSTVLFDPVLTPRLGHLRRVRGPLPAPQAAQATFVLISHLHADHAHLPSLRLVPAPAGPLVPGGSRSLVPGVLPTGGQLPRGGPRDPARL